MGEICRAKDNRYVIGLDYGTLSARAVMVCVGSGEVIAESVYVYPHGVLCTLSGVATGDGASEREAFAGADGELPADFAL